MLFLCIYYRNLREFFIYLLPLDRISTVVDRGSELTFVVVVGVTYSFLLFFFTKVVIFSFLLPSYLICINNDNNSNNNKASINDYVRGI